MASRSATATPPVAGPPATKLTLEVSHGDIEADLPIAVEDFEDAVPISIRDPMPAFLLSGPLPVRLIELPRPRPVAPAPPPLRLRGLPLVVRVTLVCGWLVLVGAVGAMVSRMSWRAAPPEGIAPSVVLGAAAR